MTSIDPDLQAHLHQPLTTLARLWLITRADDTQLGFTDHSESLAIGDLSFEAAAGFTSSAIAADNSASVNNSEVESYIDSEHISSADIQTGRYYDARVEVMIVNYQDLPSSLPSPKAPAFVTGYVGEVQAMGEDSFRFEVRGLTQLLQQKIGLNTQDLCQADLGDSNCRKDLDDFTFTATVSAVDDSNRTITVPGLTQAPDYFGNGKVNFTTGASAGVSKEVLDHAAGGVLQLCQPLPFPVQPGDQVVVVAGCRKTTHACHGKFNNIANYWAGFPHLPGQDYYASGKTGGSQNED